MGCINSKTAAADASPSSFAGRSSVLSYSNPSTTFEVGLVKDNSHKPATISKEKRRCGEDDRISNLSLGPPPRRDVMSEHVAAGWPPWLCSAAGEAIHGLVPQRVDDFQKLEKVGQGTYSCVFKAREIESGRMVALKKVRLDNLQAESVRFMAREIMILRRLDHPNIIKLEGIITSKMSQSIYLVFEYMEHDLAGLSSSPDVVFSESQVKCYMKQLLLGIEHCHFRSVMHRDIKASNILVNNKGNLKIADFGLANVLQPKNRQHLTSCVVTLWYRPPELLLGSTSYGAAVDMWSVGCVFAELFLGKPLIKGRTEVEQLHKIFRLCGSPTEEYWRKYKFPNASMFKKQHTYEGCLQEKVQDLPKEASDLIATLLSIEPEKRETASYALASKYFTTPPYACEPSSLTKYPPTKEMDAKRRNECRRKGNVGRTQESSIMRRRATIHKVLHENRSLINFFPREELRIIPELITKAEQIEKHAKMKEQRRTTRRKLSSPFDTIPDLSRLGRGECNPEGPTPITPSSGFAWARKKRGDSASSLSYDHSMDFLAEMASVDPTPVQ